MATIEELDKKYREMFPEAAGAKTTGGLDEQYQKLFGPKKEAPSIVAEEKPREFKLEAYEGPEIIDREKEPLWRKAAKWVLPKKAEEFLGLEAPMPEKTIQKKMMERETARQSYYRDQKFQKTLQDAIQAGPKEFEMPEGYEEPKAFGQLIEGIEAGYRSTLLPSVGYFTESMGRKIGSPEMIKWGMETGDATVIDFLKRPELSRPEDLKGFLDGGATDLRSYGRVIGETIPFMATVIGLSIAGGIVGGPGGALAGGWASASAIEQGNAYKKYLDEGVAPDKAADASFIYGIVAGGIENMMGFKPAGIAGKVLNPTRVATTGFKSWLLKELPRMGLVAMRKSVEEGLEEVAQQIAEDLMGKWAGSEDGMATLKELGEQFMAGAVGSLPFGVSEFRAPSFEITKPITPKDVKVKIEGEPVVPEKKIDIAEMKEADAVVVSADKFKKKFDDYDPANHEKYSAMSRQLFIQSLEEVVNPIIEFTAGGAGSGKTEMIVSQLAQDLKFDGIIYDTVLENYDAFIEKVNLAKEAGKQTEVFAILPRIESAWKFTQKRAITTGRVVPLSQFIKGHIGFVETLRKIIENNPEINVAIKDTRNIFKKEEARNAEFVYDHKKVLDTLSDLDYNEERLNKQLQYVQLSTKSQRKALAEREAAIRAEAAIPAKVPEAERVVPEEPEAVRELARRERAVKEKRLTEAAVVGEIKENGGITINLEGEKPTEGFAYSPSKDIETKIPIEKFSEKDYIDFKRKHKDILSKEGYYVGAWVNTEDGNVYLDVSKVGPVTKETIVEASKNNQLAVFDIKNLTDVKTPYYYENTYNLNVNKGENRERISERIYGSLEEFLEGKKAGRKETGPKTFSKKEIESFIIKPPKPPAKGKVVFAKEKPKGKPAKVAVSIEAKAEERDIVEKFKGLAEYEPVVIKEQMALIKKLMSENIDKAIRIATGKQPLTGGIKGAMLIKMMEDYAMESRDGDLILGLANSPLVSETSEAGQTLRLIAEREPDSATAKIQEVKMEREKVAKKRKRGKTKKQIKGEMKSNLDQEIKKQSKKINKYSWEALIDEITC